MSQGHPTGVAFDEGVVQRDAGARIEDGAVCVAPEVGGDDFVFGVAEDAFELAFALGFHFSADVGIGSGFFQLDSEIDDGDVRGGHAERHAGKLAFERGQHNAHGLGHTGAAGDDI